MNKVELEQDIINDERFSISEEAIVDAFMLLLKEKDMEKISVADIIKKAGIVRSTFYNHYENVPSMISSIEDKTLQDIFTIMKSFHPNNDYELCKNYFLTICNYTKTNPFLATLLCSPRGDAFFEKAMTMFHEYVLVTLEKNTPKNHSTDEVSYMIACTIGCVLGVLHKWTNDGFVTSPEYIADILTTAFISGMLPHLS